MRPCRSLGTQIHDSYFNFLEEKEYHNKGFSRIVRSVIYGLCIFTNISHKAVGSHRLRFFVLIGYVIWLWLFVKRTRTLVSFLL